MTSLISGKKKIAIVMGAWHDELVGQCREAFLGELKKHDVSIEDSIETIKVPGSFEIPLMIKDLAKSGKYVAFVAMGLVVNGGIYRHEFVASAVIDGLMKVQLDLNLPVLSAVLTPINFHEHETHQEFFKRHLSYKGVEVANSLVELLKIRSEVL